MDRFARCGALAVAFCLLAGTPAGVRAAAAPSAVPLAIDWSLSPAQIAATCKSEIATAGQRVTALTRLRSARTFDTVVRPLETIFADLNDRTAADIFLTQVASDKDVRAASLACGTDESAFFAEVSARPELYAALKAARDSKTASTEADKKLTELWLTASFRAGAALDDTKRAAFIKLNAHLTDLQNRFGANIADDATTIAITPAQAAGLAPDFVATFTKTATGYVVPVNESTNGPFLRNATDAGARKMFYLAYGNRAASQNVAILEEAIATRDQLAHLFGYPTWAAYVLADKMAQSPQRVDTFLTGIDTAILPKARLESARLARLKGAPLDAWDSAFYDNQLRKTEYAVDANAVKQYFPVQHTVDAILAIYAEILGVTFARIDRPAVWNAEVVGYDVHDTASGALLGTFYLDLFPRPGKFGHFASFPVVPRRVLPDGSVRAPLAVIVGNWSRPAPGRPAVLTHDEVETFFHEFGHNMAAMLGTQPYETLNNGFRADFIEAPSQMLENWVWDPAILKQISANVVTGAPLPDELIKKMIAARYVDYSLATTRQILYASVDMAYHTGGAHVDTTAIWLKLAPQLTPFAQPAGTHPQAAFGHLMSGYDAGYYGYQWSKVYAQDMFTAFQAGGLESPAVGRRYRDDILAPAREREPDAEVEAFLGRPMSPTAYYTELGITPPQTATR
jgi:thimet oligopeptidase